MRCHRASAAASRHRVVGCSITPSDESGDAHLFTQRLAARCQEAGVVFRYRSRIVEVRSTASGISAVRLDSDAFVLCLGWFSAGFAARAGMALDSSPARGYSGTLTLQDPTTAYCLSLTDDEYKLIFPAGR